MFWERDKREAHFGFVIGFNISRLVIMCIVREFNKLWIFNLQPDKRGPSSRTYRTILHAFILIGINPLTPNDHYSGRTALLTPKRCIMYIYSTNIGTE